MQPISIESCVNLVKAEHDRNFIIIVMLDSFILRSKTITKFNELFAQSPCNHKLGLIDVREDIRMQIYYTLVGSLNLALAFTVDGILKTFGILVDQNNSEIKSSLVSSNYEPIPIEIINIKPIILDMERCGVLEPILYFVARDIGTCIAQVLLPGSTTWSVAYLIQCDDSGRNDHDMVKVCLINEKSTEKDVSVLNNSNYPLCRAISGLLYDLKHLPASLDVVTPLIKVMRAHLINFF